jgi:hypothetical protein
LLLYWILSVVWVTSKEIMKQGIARVLFGNAINIEDL